MKTWLSGHPDYRVATSEDCHCDDDIESIRRTDSFEYPAVPGYQPYFMQGDFDGDGDADVAIVAISNARDHKIVILASLGASDGRKSVLREVPVPGQHLQSRALFCAQPYPESPEQACRLLFGAFHSEAEEVLR